MERVSGINRHPRKLLGISLLALAALNLLSCGSPITEAHTDAENPKGALEVMSLAWEKDLLFEKNFFESFGERNRFSTHFVPNARLALYEKLFRAHSSQPDLVEVDVVWPGILADDLIDLRPFLKDHVRDFPAALLASYTVRGKLVALPMLIDVGALYYRVDLLEKYGFQRPPRTWDELEMMATRIQRGERLGGDKDFWGYTWQGARSEGGTCNALEWQASAGAGNFIEDSGRVHVRSGAFIAALQRALRWMGTISPPASYVYWEDDSMNLWDAGQTAFMRNWASGYGHVSDAAAKSHRRFAVAPLPGGAGGSRGTLGGLGMGISKYAANREVAVRALLEISDPPHSMERLIMTSEIPSRISIMDRSDVKSRNSLLALSSELTNGLVARPSVVLGRHYDEASLEYSKAVNKVLRREQTPESALAELETRLVELTGLPVQRN